MFTVDASSETKFNELKVEFGAKDDADKLNLNQFVLLSDKRAQDLADRIENAQHAGEILEIRHRAKQAQSQQVPPAGSREEMIEDLLIRSGLTKSQLDLNVVRRMNSRYANKVLLALRIGSADLAREAYNWTQSLPQTSTCRNLKEKSIIVDECLIGNNEYLEICFVERRKPSVLKSVSLTEYRKVKMLLEANVKHKHIVPIQLETLHGKNFVIMPLLPITVEHLCGISEDIASELWDQIGSALECLHSHGFAHKDVKSANICIDNNGDFILIDLGSTVKFGFRSASTTEYVPEDVDGTEGANALIDWWMLAMTVYDRMQPSLRGGTSFRTVALLKWFEDNEYYELLERIKSKVAS